MERLQAAIEKARSQQPKRQKQQEKQVPKDTHWASLPALELKTPALKHNRIFTAQASAAEGVPFDILRTRTLRAMQEKGWRRLAITSPTASCGKSTLTLNLGLSMSRQRDTRTIQFEMDMRRPSQSKLMDLDLSPDAKSDSNVEKLLTRQASFEETANLVQPGLAVVYSAKSVSNASDILLDQNVPDVLNDIEARYQPDIMLFDMPPALMNDDTSAFVKHVDCVLRCLE